MEEAAPVTCLEESDFHMIYSRASCKTQVNFSPGIAPLQGDYISSFNLARFFRVCRRIQASFDEKPVQTEPTGAIFPRFRHVCVARVVQAVWRWFGLEGGLDQLPRYLIYTKHNNTEHQARLDFLVSTHPQVARQG